MSAPRMEFLAPHDEPVIVFRRTFNAPARLVFAAWTEPQHLRHRRGGAERGLAESHHRLDELLGTLVS